MGAKSYQKPVNWLEVQRFLLRDHKAGKHGGRVDGCPDCYPPNGIREVPDGK